MNGEAIALERLTKRYDGRAVVDELDLTIRRAEMFALLGPNGAGKTTTVEIVEGYRTPDGGTVRVMGLDPRRDGGRLRPQMGLMLQSGGLYSQLRPLEALELFAAFYPAPLDPARLLEQVGLARVARSRYRDLSGGERQRLSLALAIVGRPRLAILDEPTSAMDAQARRETWAVLRGLRDGGTTVLFTTHFLDEAEALADRVAIIDRGRLVALGTPAELRRGIGIRTPAAAPGAVPAPWIVPSPGSVAAPGAVPGSVAAPGSATPAIVAPQAGVSPTDGLPGDQEVREVRLELPMPLDVDRLGRLSRLPSAATVRTDRPGVYVIRTAAAGELLVELSTWLLALDIEPLAIRVGQGSLEDVFLRLVGEEAAAR